MLDTRRHAAASARCDRPTRQRSSDVSMSRSAPTRWTCSWWNQHKSPRFQSAVRPPVVHGTRWWMSQAHGGAVHPSYLQCRSLAITALASAGGTVLVLRPSASSSPGNAATAVVRSSSSANMIGIISNTCSVRQIDSPNFSAGRRGPALRRSQPRLTPVMGVHPLRSSS
jgi:hypothetical protein